MKVLIAPDKFKGSLTAGDVCEIVKNALASKNPELTIETVPLADGGDGTCEMLTTLTKGRFVELDVMDPLMRKIKSEYGISADGQTAFIEMALASGLVLLKPEERDCTITSTYGTGQLIKDAIERGVKEIVMGIGGSATNDAGTGMAQALGFRFLSKSGKFIDGVGKNLVDVKSIDSDEVSEKILNTKFTVLSDVENPLYGSDGAAYVFAKQKGATDDEVISLDKGLQNFAKIAEEMEIDITFPGAGAAGGLGAGAKVFLNAELKHGIEFIMEFVQLEEKVKHADAIITGEGKIDSQTLSGKVVMGVASLARKYKKRLIVVCGVCELNNDQLNELGVDQVIAIKDEKISTKEAMQNASQILSDRAITIAI